MTLHAVIDTNVIVSGLLTKNNESPTRVILDNVFSDKIIPLLNSEIMMEYTDVLSRGKFRLSEQEIRTIIDMFSVKGETCPRCPTGISLPDPDDLVFYETYASCENYYLITGNKKHFPSEGKIVSPAEMVQILHQMEQHASGILSEPQRMYISEEKAALIAKAWETIERIRMASVENGTSDMSMEEIDEEIRKCRRG